MAIKTSVRFQPTDSPAQIAEKMNKVLLEIQRQGGAGKTTTVAGGGGGGGISASTTTIIQESSFARHFMFMGA